MALSVNVNSTILYADNWRNGSLFPQLQNANNLSSTYTTVYTGNSQDQHLDLIILANDIAQLTFNASGFYTPSFHNDNISLASTFALAETLFDPDLRRFPVTCVYPISGQYDTLSRALFYVLMIFSLVFRRHIWISVAALGTAMVYAATSAVHLFALVSLFGFSKDPTENDTNSAKAFSDIDFIGILPNLAASAIMLTPILLWSTTVRKYDAQSIIIWWGCIIFAALACLLYKVQDFKLDSLTSFAICAKDCIPQTNIESGSLPFAVYQNCSCIDFCGTLSPTAPLRKGANMVAWFDAVNAQKVVEKPYYQDIFLVNIVALIFIAIYGVMALIISRFRPDEVRNSIFRFFNSDLRLWLKVIFEGDREDRALAYFNVKEKDTGRTVWKKCKYVFAKVMAACFSLTAGATAIICPAVFISTIIANEFMIQLYPVSEHSDAVGAWATWVGALLVLIAAVINKYSDAWVKTIKVILYSVWRFIKYSKHDRKRLYPKTEDMKVSTRLKLFGRVLGSPFVHSLWSLRRGFWTFRTTIHFFCVWWRDTENMSQQRGKAIEAAWEAEVVKVPGGKPECNCYVCKHDEEDRLAKEEEEAKSKNSASAYDSSNVTSGAVLVPSAPSVAISRPSTSSLPLKTYSIDVNELSPKVVQDNGQGRPTSPPYVPLPTPRSTFARQDTGDSMA